MTGRVGTVRCEFCLPRHEIRLGSADVADLKRIHNFGQNSSLLHGTLEILPKRGECENFWYNEVVPKNRHPHLRLKHRHADAEHIRLETNTMMFLIMFSPDFMVENMKKAARFSIEILSLLLLASHFWLVARKNTVIIPRLPPQSLQRQRQQLLMRMRRKLFRLPAKNCICLPHNRELP